MGNLQSLTYLNVGANQFTGPVSMLSSLTSLEILQMSNNKFTDSLGSLSGLSELIYLRLVDNDFYGLILPAITELCERENTYCQFSNNKRLCGDGERGEYTRSHPSPTNTFLS